MVTTGVDTFLCLIEHQLNSSFSTHFYSSILIFIMFSESIKYPERKESFFTSHSDEMADEESRLIG